MGAAVALRSGDPAVVEAVRAVVMLADLPLEVHPPGSAPPSASLVLDSVAETTSTDPDWGTRSPGFAWVGVDRRLRPPDGAPYLVLPDAGPEILARIRSGITERRARVIGVVPARGGAGATALAAVLARCCSEARLSAGLVDLDGDNGGLEVLLGMEHEPGLRWADLADERGYAPPDLAQALPSWHGVRVLSHDLRGTGGISGAVAEPALAALTAHHDAVVLDLPRPQTRAGGLAARWCDAVVVVATCDMPSAAGAQALGRMLAGVPTQLVVRGPSPGGMTAHDLAMAARLPLLVSMPPERSLTKALERGVAPGDHRRGPLVRAGRLMLADLGLGS